MSNLLSLICKLTWYGVVIQTGWGTRAGIGDPTAATSAAGAVDEKIERPASPYRDIPSPPDRPYYERDPVSPYGQAPHTPPVQQQQYRQYQQPAVELGAYAQ